LFDTIFLLTLLLLSIEAVTAFKIAGKLASAFTRS
jgi:hypothetical protein